MKIVIGCDHGGFELKETVLEYLKEKGYDVEDIGCYSSDSVDYADIALPAAQGVAEGKYDKGILICGTGLGIGITANKVPGVRCALLENVFSAKMTRLHNDANMMSMGGRVVGPGLALEIVEAFLTTPFSGEERHARRIAMITEIEKTYSK